MRKWEAGSWGGNNRKIWVRQTKREWREIN